MTGARKRGLGFWTRAGVAGASVAAIAGGALIAGNSGRPTASQSSPPSAPRTAQHLKLAAAPPNNMYWLVAADGGIFTEPLGVTPYLGGEGWHHLNQPVVGMAATPDGKGYWLVAKDGGLFTEGDAGYYGSRGNVGVSAPIVGMAATPDGHGYWMVGSDGHVYNFGDAPDYGSEWPKHLNQPVVGMAATPDGGGYWLVAADGGVFTHGDAPYLGGEGWHHLNQPVVGMAASPDGKGYWLAAADGGVFTEGNILYYGSQGYHHLNQPVVGIAATPTGHGYWLVASDGGIFSEGPDAGFGGSEGYHQLNQPVVGMAAVPVLFASTISLTPTAGTIVADGVSTSTITAVVRDSSGNAIPGRSVAFSVTTPGCGSLSSSRGLTDLSGAVVTTYTSSTQVGNCSVRASDLNAAAANTVVIAQSVGAPMHIAATPSGASSPDADQGNAGIPVSFTVTDNQGHGVPGTTIDLSTTLANGSVAASGVTNASGVLNTTVNDTTAGDTGTVTGTIHGTGIQMSTGTMTIKPGSVATLSVPTSPTTQTAGSGYTVAIDAVDAYGNPTNPSTSILGVSGTALDTASDVAQTAGTATWEPAGFSNGEGLLDVTSYKAEQGVVLGVTDTNAPAVTTSTSPYDVDAGAFTTLVKPTVGSQTAGQLYKVTVNATDQWANPVNPNTADLAVTGSALDTASDVAHTPGTATWEPAGFVNGAALLDMTSYKAESAAFTITDNNDNTITTSTDQYTVAAGPLKVLVKPTIGTQRAGTQYTVTIDATDQWANPVNPNTSDLTVSGSALDPALNVAHTPATDAWEAGGFVAGEAKLDVTSVKAESAVLTVTDKTDNTITTSSDAYTVNPSAMTSITLSAPNPTQPTAGTSYTLTLSGFDQYANATGPSGGGITYSGTAKDIAPDSNPLHTGTAQTGTFTNGVATVTATSYEAGSEDLTATYTNGNASFPSNKQTYTVKDAGYSAILPSYTGGSSYVRVDSGTTPTLVITQPPTGTSAPASATVTLIPVDQYQNHSSSTDALTTQLSPDATVPDKGTLTGGVPPSADYVSGQPVTVTASETFSSNSASFTYQPSTPIPATSAGTLTTTDSAKSITLTMHVVTTQVAQILVRSTLSCSVCTAGATSQITYLAEDANGSPVPGAYLDLSRTGLASATLLPTSPAQTDGSGLLTASVTDNTAPESGTVLVGVHDVASSDVNLFLTSSPITYQAGPATQLWISKSQSAGEYNAGAPSSETAGSQYTLYVWSLDALNNPSNPTGSVPVSGTALDGVTGGGSSSSSVGVFTNGIATLTVTSAKANASAGLAPAGTCGNQACTAHGITFPVNPGSANSISSSLSPAGGTYTADQGSTGIGVNFLVKDSEGNPVPSTTVNVSKSNGLTGNVIGSPATTDGTGTASVTLTDTVAGDSGTLTGTVNGTNISIASPTITITVGAIRTLAFGAVTTQVAGAPYSVSVAAQDAEHNPANPSWVTDLTLTGSALFNSPGPANTQASVTKNAFSGGSATVGLTSYRAQAAGPNNSVDQLSLVCTSSALQSGICDANHPPSVTVDYAINPSTATQVVVRDSSNNVTAAASATSPSQNLNYTIKLEDAYNNVAVVQTGTVQILLSPGATPDGGFLSGGGNFTTVDTAGPQTLSIDLSKATAFTYTAPPVLPTGGTGTLTFTDQSSPLPSRPSQIAISD